MFASPFFSAGRAAILPVIARDEEPHTANSITQTTQSTTATIGSLLAGFSAARFGYHWAFLINSASFLFSAWCIWHLAAATGFRAQRSASPALPRTPFHDFHEGLSYMWSVPLMIGIAM